MDRLPPHLSQLLTTNWLGPHGHVLHYPVRRGELMNFISIVERDDWQVKSWIVEGSKDELAGDFRDWHADVHTFIDQHRDALQMGAAGARADAAVVGRTRHAARRRLPSDAAVSRPGRGDGDRGRLRRRRVSWRSIANEPERAFARYEDIRKERTSAVVRKSHENRAHVFSPALADSGALADEVARYWQQQHVRERLDWLYQYDATAIAV